MELSRLWWGNTVLNVLLRRCYLYNNSAPCRMIYPAFKRMKINGEKTSARAPTCEKGKQIGRASCREREEITVVAASCKKRGGEEPTRARTRHSNAVEDTC